jgi:hypothetical protein
MNKVGEKNKRKEEARMKSSITTIVNNIKAKTITFCQKRMIIKRKDNKQ